MQTDPANQKHRETDRDRTVANIFLLVFFVVIVGIGIWLANAMMDARNLDDCLAQGRRNCAPIERPVPPR
jgi:hypothetical protein